MFTHSRRQTPVDNVFFLDGTGSMAWCFEQIVNSICGFAQDLSRGALDWRLALCVFRDLRAGEAPKFFDFTTDVQEFQGWVRSQEATGGGANGGESCIDAMLEGLSRYRFRANALRSLLLLTDEPPHDPDESGRSMSDVRDALRLHRVVPYVVSTPLRAFLALAGTCGGLHFDIATSRLEFVRMLYAVSKSISTASTAGSSYRRAVNVALSGGRRCSAARVTPVPRDGRDRR